MSPLMTTIRRLSRSNSARNTSGNNSVNNQNQTDRSVPPNSFTPPLSNVPGASSPYSPPRSQVTMGAAPTGASGLNGSRPVSANTNSSFDFLARPVSHGYPSIPTQMVGNLSRTDQIVLRHFWDQKHADNAKRDLHFLRFPYFGPQPSHQNLLPYCEIYHLVKTSPGARIISLGSANGVYIGFELASGAQLHIDMDDEWENITHHRVAFKSFESMLHDNASEVTFKSWPKPLTIEFLEEQYLRWCLDLTSFCWADESVRELGVGAAGRDSAHGGDFDDHSPDDHEGPSKDGLNSHSI